ncbi:cupin domain-containing protein [Geitlerinema sp. P-1104]|nr:cupin domain-containing protein [Geitlerinema sp. P-1104]
MYTAADWIETLDLVPLPEEGGLYRELYRSDELIPQSALPERFGGDRTYCTSIYYLLENPEFSAFHRIQQEEIWHFYEGSPLTLFITEEGV